MFYPDDAKRIYTSPAGTKYDPLAVHRKLVLAGGGRLNDHLASWADPETPEVARAAAEEELVRVARDAFALGGFAEEGGSTDREALDALCDFLEWLAGKASRGSKPPA